MIKSSIETPHPPPSKVKRWLKRIIYTLLALIILFIAFWVYMDIQLGDDDIPMFDRAKAKRLSPEKRREYDVQLFNQLVVRGEMPSEPRYWLFRKMADDGFEVAYLTLLLFDIRYSDLPRKYPMGLDRLKELAKQGDASAQCLYGAYGYLFETGADNKKIRMEYIKVAARQNHPACSATYGVLFARNKEEEIEWMKRAAEGGDMLAQLMLAEAYARGIGATHDFGLARCWANEAVIQSKTIYAASGAQSMRWHEDNARREGRKVEIKRYRPSTNCSEIQK